MLRTVLTCTDFERVELSHGCCSSCHEDWEEYGYYMGGPEPPRNKHGRASKVGTEVCCACFPPDHEPTRADFAKALRAKRNANRGR